MKRLVLTLALLVAGIESLSAQVVAGEWDGIMNTPGAQVPLHFTLKVTGDSLTGTVKRTTGDVPLVGRVKKDSVSFSYTIMYQESPFPLAIRARVVGDSLVGIVDFGEGTTETIATRRVAVRADSTRKAVPATGGGRRQ